MILADKIIENRKKNGWSQEELADKLGVSRQSVSKWEGAQAIPDMKKILQMAELFGVTTDYLLKDEIEETALVEMQAAPDYVDEEEAPIRVSMEEANSFLNHNWKAASVISTGVMLCILSAAPLLILLGLAEGNGPLANAQYQVTAIGIAVILVMVACAVALFIMTSLKGKPYEYLENKKIDTDYGVSGMVKERKSKYASTHAKLLVPGIALCIISAIPLFMSMILQEWGKGLKDLPAIIGAAMILVMIAVGVKMIVLTCIRQGGFEKLLEEGDYTRLNKKASKWDGIYWAIVVAIYLAWSFITMKWEMTWIVWPIAGVVFAAYKEIIKLVISSKKG